MNYGTFLSAELQKSARTINFNPNKGVGDNTDTMQAMQRASLVSNYDPARHGNAFRLPGYEKEDGQRVPSVTGASGKTPQAAANNMANALRKSAPVAQRK